jgi:hypothetical protein
MTRLLVANEGRDAQRTRARELLFGLTMILDRSLSLRSTALALVACAALFACGGATDATGTSSSGSSGVIPSPSASSPFAPDTKLLSVYHLDQVDATNLELRPDGSFQWTIEGCDFGGGQCGGWAKQDDKLVLSGGPPGLEWSYGGSFKQRVTALVATKKGDDLVVSGLTASGESFTQLWKQGRSCALCGGQLGPTGQSACSDPLPKMCAQ